MPPAIFIPAFVIISLLGILLTKQIKSYTISYSIFDIPNERSSHTAPIPRGGGLAIVTITLGGLGVIQVLEQICPWPKFLAYLGGALLISTISWLDDLHPLSASLRFGIQSLAALLVLVVFGFWKNTVFPFECVINSRLIGLPINFIWIVGLTNCFNFMDGIDGIAGTQALVAGIAWALLGWLSNILPVVALGTLLAGTSLGFLWYNWPPAKIFMGDVGSAFLGYNFAFLTLLGAKHNPSLGPAVIILVWPFLFDTGFTFFRRLKNGENVFAAHRSHLYQRLVISGYPHRTITFIYLGLEVLGLLMVISIFMKKPWAGLLPWTVLPLASFGLWGFTVFREKNTKDKKTTGSFTPFNS